MPLHIQSRQGHLAGLFRGCTFMGALIVCVATVVLAAPHPARHPGAVSPAATHLSAAVRP